MLKLDTQNYSERNIYARIQRYYNILCEHQYNIEAEITPETMHVECELEELIKEFERIFSEIIYTE